jgi:Plus-3 domain
MVGLLFCQFINGFVDLAPDFVKPYKVNDKTMNQAFELRHGRSLKVFMMDKVSNGPFLEVKRYFERPMFGFTQCFNIERV